MTTLREKIAITLSKDGKWIHWLDEADAILAIPELQEALGDAGLATQLEECQRKLDAVWLARAEHLGKAEAERDRLRAAIESAPHTGSYCRYDEGSCDCWKREALTEVKP